MTPPRAGRAPGSRAAAAAAENEDPALAAVQAALSAEHAAVYGYGVVGGRIGAERAAEAREAHAAHRARRDQLHRAVTELEGTPTAAAAGYALPFEVTDSASAVELAAELESRLAGVYADLVGAAEGDTRELAAEALREAAVRAARWSGQGVPFPGLPGPGDAASRGAERATEREGHR